MTDTWTLTQRTETPYGTIAFDVMGTGPPLVIVHGTPFSSFVWRAFARALAETHTVHLYDLLGYGASEQPDGDVSLGVQPRVLAHLLEHWQLDQPTVLAHDFGGTTSLRAHLLHACDYRALLVVDPVAVAPWGSPFVHHVRTYFEAFATVPDYIHSGILDAYIQDAAHNPLSPQTLGALKAPWQGETGQPAFYRQIAQMDPRYTDEIEPLYATMRCPVHIFWGEEDTWIPIERGEALHSLIPGSSFTRIPGAGHLVQEDQPERLLSEIQARLSG